MAPPSFTGDAAPAPPRRPLRIDDLAALPDEAIDVALGAALIARDAYAGLDVERLLARFDELAAPLVGAGLAALSTEEQAARLAAHVYGTLGFRGNEKDYYDPRNSLLPDVLDRRLGIPITLALVYGEVARRAGVPARGVGFPGHFLIRIERPASSENVAPALVDPFFGGRIVDDATLKRLLERALGAGAALKPEHVEPATPRAILVRMLTNLKAVYLQRGDHARAHLALDRLVTLASPSARPQLAMALRERGLVAAKLGAHEAARADLARVLEIDPQAADAAAIRAQVAKLSALASRRRVLN